MAYNGSGTYNRIYSWVADKANGLKINATRMDAEMDGMATGLSNAVCKDGQTQPTANLPMNGFLHTNVGNATARNQYATVAQVQDGAYLWGGTAGGTANSLTITTIPAVSAYAAGQTFRFLVAATNTSGATLTPNAGVVGNVYRIAGTTPVPLFPGDLRPGMVAEVVADGLLGYVLLNPQAGVSFSAYKASDQTGIVPSTETKVTFTTEEWDDGGYYDATNSKFLPLVAGKYRVTAAAYFNAGVVDGNFHGLRVYKNGVLYKGGSDVSGNAVYIQPQVNCLVDLNGSTDYIEIYANTLGAGNKTILGNQVLTYFQAEHAGT